MGAPPAIGTSEPPRRIDGYEVSVSSELEDSRWDEFLEGAEGSPYCQTSGWARTRTHLGWSHARVVVSRDGAVVAGVQLATRPLPAGGQFGVVLRGPVFAAGAPAELVRLTFDEMLALAKASKVLYLVVHPPRGGEWMSEEMARRGMRPSLYQIEYTATVLIDLTPEHDELLGRMKRSTRRYLRSVHDSSVSLRRGTAEDLPVFDHLKKLQSERIGYTPRPDSYYSALWDALSERGHVELFVAEYEGEPVSALLSVPFGDTCYHLEGPWSGEHADLRPNEMLEWFAFQWAKSQGYRYVDLMALARPAAEAILAGQPPPPDLLTAEQFKLGFGGDVTLLPLGYEYVGNPVLRSVYSVLPRRLLTSDRARALVRRMRTHAWGRRET